MSTSGSQTLASRFLFDPHIVLIFFPISLALETSEIQERFQCQDAVKDKEELAAELADVALYLLQLASVTEIDLEKAILDKIGINKTREWNQE